METTPGDGRTRRALRNAAHLLTGRVATLLVLAASAVLIPRATGAEAYGLYASVLAMAAMLEALSSGGLQMAEIRYVAPAWQQGDWERALTYASTIWLTRLGLAILAAALAAPWLLSTGHLASGVIVGFLAAYVGVRCAFEATRHLLLSVGRPGPMAWLEFARAVSVLTLVLLAFPVAGLEAVFSGLPVVQGLLLAVATAGLLSTVPLRARHFDLRVLRSVARFSTFTWVGVVAWVLQSQFAVYAAATFVSLEEAAVLAVTVQMYGTLLALLTAARTSLLPVLSEMHEGGERAALERWAGALQRWAAFLGTAGLLAWALLGDHLARLLPDQFAPIHEAGTVMLAAVVLVAGGFVANGFLYAAGLSGVASASRVAFALVTVAGVEALILARGGATAVEMTGVYLAAGAVFCVLATISVRRRLGLCVPLASSALLVAPGAVAWPLVGWEAALPTKLAAAMAALGAYLGYALALRLLRPEELRALRRHARG